MLGQHPETQLDIVYKIGRFGPYYEHGALRFSAGATAHRVEAGTPREGEDAWRPTLEHAIARLDTKAHKSGALPSEKSGPTFSSTKVQSTNDNK